MFKDPGKIRFWIGFLTIEFYYPRIKNNSQMWFAVADTIVIYHKYHENQLWMVTRAFAIKVLGFGVGLAWKHLDNPTMQRLKAEYLESLPGK